MARVGRQPARQEGQEEEEKEGQEEEQEGAGGAVPE